MNQDLKCQSCGAQHVDELRDGRDLIELAITTTPMDGYLPVYDPPQQKRVLCASCLKDKGFDFALAELGFPWWFIHGWKNEADAVADGWDPEQPHVNPFDDEE